MNRLGRRIAWAILASMMVTQQAFAQFELLEGMESQKSTKKTEQLHQLTQQQGPVMVKVASFIGKYVNPQGQVYANGLEMANALVKELREEHGIEAYTYLYQDERLVPKRTEKEKKQFEQQLQLFEEKFKVRPRVLKLRTPPPENWVVLAGNFDGFEDRSAHRYLEKIRDINPACISGEVRRQLRFNRTENDAVPTPLKSAMLVRNPLVPKETVVVDSGHEKLLKMLLELNDGERYSLYQLKARATIQVAQYRGVAVVGEEQAKGFFSRKKVKEGKANLQESAKRAILLCEILRNQGMESYVFHGKFASIVTVGGYNNANDPRLPKDMEKLAQTKIQGVQLEPRVIPTPRHPSSFQGVGASAN